MSKLDDAQQIIGAMTFNDELYESRRESGHGSSGLGGLLCDRAGDTICERDNDTIHERDV